jgi:hypothetical protein
MTCAVVKPELEGIWAKLDRALLHLHSVDEEVREFAKGKTHTLRGEYEPETSCYVFKIAIHQRPKTTTGVILGDFVHNLRSALDHLVWQLADAKGTAGSWTKFPLYDDPGKFTGQVTTPGLRGKVNPLWGLEGTPPWQAIEALQPHHGGHDNLLLGALHDLSNEDKHHVVLQAVTGVRAPDSIDDLQLTRNADAGEIGEIILVVGKPLEDGTEVVRVHLKPSGPNPQVKMEGRLNLDIAFGRGTILGEYLPKMVEATGRVIEDFQNRFF